MSGLPKRGASPIKPVPLVKLSVAVLTLGAALWPGPAAEPTGPDGTRKMTGISRGGGNAVDPSDTVVIGGSKMTFYTGGYAEAVGLKVDGSKSPAWIDMTVIGGRGAGRQGTLRVGRGPDGARLSPGRIGSPASRFQSERHVAI